MRIENHPILGKLKIKKIVHIDFDGEMIEAVEGEPIATALLAAGESVFRYTQKRHEPRGVFCAIGQCTDCMMIVDSTPNVRTCITVVKDGMKVQTQYGIGELKDHR
ncbi:MAG: (2Fe-2S)-binding protein [Planctomycetes bacterium]|nr:(2Fe-2S)-binding protein [Planctomycetota bacterium]